MPDQGVLVGKHFEHLNKIFELLTKQLSMQNF